MKELKSITSLISYIDMHKLRFTYVQGQCITFKPDESFVSSAFIQEDQQVMIYEALCGLLYSILYTEQKHPCLYTKNIFL